MNAKSYNVEVVEAMAGALRDCREALRRAGAVGELAVVNAALAAIESAAPAGDGALPLLEPGSPEMQPGYPGDAAIAKAFRVVSTRYATDDACHYAAEIVRLARQLAAEAATPTGDGITNAKLVGEVVSLRPDHWLDQAMESRASARDQPATPAGGGDLPELPEPSTVKLIGDGPASIECYTPDDMREYGERCRLASTQAAGGGGEAVAEALWHRFGDDSRLTWDEEPEKAIYRDAAAQAIAMIRRLASGGGGELDANGLLPCPFCGAAALGVVSVTNALPERHSITCSDARCLATVEGRTAQRARLMWNRRLASTGSADRLAEQLKWALEQGGVLADWCNVARPALVELMAAYERRVRSDCKTEADLAAEPWRCAEFVQAEKALRAKPVPVVEIASTGSAQSEPQRVECRECGECGHVGINDLSLTDDACGDCGWSGPAPTEDKCPECSHENCMGAACPGCGSRYRLIAESELPATGSAPAPSGWRPIETAPKSAADGSAVAGVYLLGFCFDPDLDFDPQACIDIVWWEPLLPNRAGGRGKWCRNNAGEAIEVSPTHWQPLPAAPTQEPPRKTSRVYETEARIEPFLKKEPTP